MDLRLQYDRQPRYPMPVRNQPNSLRLTTYLSTDNVASSVQGTLHMIRRTNHVHHDSAIGMQLINHPPAAPTVNVDWLPVCQCVA